MSTPRPEEALACGSASTTVSYTHLDVYKRQEKGMTLPGARQRLKDNKEATVRNYEIVNKLKAIKEELLAIRTEDVCAGEGLFCGIVLP